MNVHRLSKAGWLLAAIALGAASCGGDADTSGSGTEAPQETQAANEGEADSGNEGQIVIAASGGGIGETTEKLVREWADTAGAEVAYDAGTLDESYAKVLAQKDDQTFDVVSTNAWTEGRGIEEGLFEPLDPEIVSNLEEIYPLARVENDLGVRYGFAEIGILYNAKIYEEEGIDPPTSWEDLWAPEVKGRVMLGDIGGAYSRTYMAYLAKDLTGDEANVEAAVDYVEERKDWILAIGANIAQREQILLSEEAWIMPDGSASGIPFSEANPDFQYVRPSEGTPIFWNSFNLLKGAPNPTAAQEFINYSVSAEAQQWFAPEGGYAPVHPDAELEEEYAAKIPYGPEGIDSLIDLDPTKLVESQDELTRLWEERIVE